MELGLTLASESKLAGSAGIDSSTDLVSTATTPVGMPPSLWIESSFGIEYYKTAVHLSLISRTLPV